MEVLDLFSAAAGGWSLGMHRAGFKTIAACEYVEWRRALYQQNNPGVRIYDDVCTLTADRLVRDFGRLPSVVVGSPPCQDISSANTKGKGVEGERSGLYFEAVRIIGEVRPRWFALENSSNLRTRGADAVLSALEALGYACWSYVVRAGDIGANHERPRCWIIGCDLDQVADAGSWGQWQQPRRWDGQDRAHQALHEDHDQAKHDADTSEAQRREILDSGGYRDGEAGQRCQSPDRHAEHAEACGANAPDTDGIGRDEEWSGRRSGLDVPLQENSGDPDSNGENKVRSFLGRPSAECDGSPSARDASDADQADGCMVAGLRQAEITDDGRGAGWSDDGSIAGQVGVCAADRLDAQGWRSDWSLDDLAGRVLLDARIQAWTFVAFLLDAGGQGCLAEQLIAEAKSAGFAAKLSIGSDLQAGLRTVLASYSESTALRLAPIAETMSDECSITLAPENSWDFAAKSAEEINGSPSTTSMKSGPTTQPRTSKRSARHAIPSTTSERDLKAVHRQAERRFKQSASRLVEAFGDAVVPQIPEAIGRAILRTEAALAAIYGRAAA